MFLPICGFWKELDVYADINKVEENSRNDRFLELRYYIIRVLYGLRLVKMRVFTERWFWY